MKTIKYIALTFLLAGAMSLQAMENNNNNNNLNPTIGIKRSADSETDLNNDEEYIKKTVASLKKTVALSLCVQIQKDLEKLDPKAPDIIFNYITGKQIIAGKKRGYEPLNFQARLPVKEVLPLQQYLHLELIPIIQDILDTPYVRQWAPTINSYQIIERILSPDEKKVAEKMLRDSSYFFYLPVRRIMDAALKTTPPTIRETIKEQAQLDSDNREHAKEWTLLGLDEWHMHKQKEHAHRLQAFLKTPYQDEEIEKNKQYLFDQKS